MRVSLRWLRRYVTIDEKPDQLARELTMFGLNVEEITTLSPAYEGVLFGRVLDVEKHPAADRLTLCTVDVGGEVPLSIVCGAPNVRAGLRVPVAVDGAVLPGGFKIKRTKIRGVVSEGMICSEKELGIGEEASGIVELDFDEPLGTDLRGLLGGTDVTIEVEVTPNRPDQLCHIGVAREIAALFKRPLVMPARMELSPSADFRIEIENGDDCPRYTAAFVDDVRIGPSPAWMQELLTAVGVKPINNIVDVTNFVLMEYGHPLHAFDRSTLAQDMISVRRAREGETMVTLDGMERTLHGDMLVIADGERPVALAGVMGGLETEVTDRTTRVLLESAMFDPRVVRHGRQRLKMETEASYRFEREADAGITREALERACLLIEEIGAGRPMQVCRDRIAQEESTAPRVIGLRTRQANRVMGTHLGSAEIVALLARLGLQGDVDEKEVLVRAPTFRRDLREEIDLIEEVARVYGYENIGREGGPSANIFSSVSPVDRMRESLCDYLTARGFCEIITSSFMDPGDVARCAWLPDDPRTDFVEVANPLTANQTAMRTSLLPGMLGAVRRNTPAEAEGLRLFEVGKVFIKLRSGNGLPCEELHLLMTLTRKAAPLSWIEKQREADFFDMMGEFEGLLTRFAPELDTRMIRYEDSGGFVFRWMTGDRRLACGGMLPRSVTGAYDIDTPVFHIDLDLDMLSRLAGREPSYTVVSPYPAVKRDLCLVAGERVEHESIRRMIERNMKHLESIRLFDYYRGGQLGGGKRSYTFRLSFRSTEGTLDDRTVDREIERVLALLQRELQVVLRM